MRFLQNKNRFIYSQYILFQSLNQVRPQYSLYCEDTVKYKYMLIMKVDHDFSQNLHIIANSHSFDLEGALKIIVTGQSGCPENS